MRITVFIDGGLAVFPGLNGPRTLDTNDLSPADAAGAAQLVAASNFFSLARVISTAPKGAGDVRTIRVRVEDGSRHHEVSAIEPITNEPLLALVALVTSRGKSAAIDLSRKEP